MTRAQEFRNLVERSGPKRPKQVKQKPRPRFSHNDAPTAGESRATYAIEETQGRRSRKSTRSSSNRVRTDSPLQLTTLTHLIAPQRRREAR